MHIVNVINTSPHQHTIPTSFHQMADATGLNKVIEFDALIDSGALQGNYMSESAALKLDALSIIPTGINIRVCSAFDDCQTASKQYEIILKFNTFMNDSTHAVDDNNRLINFERFEATLTFSVLKSLSYDLIIGRPSILKYKIWERTMSPHDILVSTQQQPVATKTPTVNALHTTAHRSTAHSSTKVGGSTIALRKHLLAQTTTGRTLPNTGDSSATDSSSLRSSCHGNCKATAGSYMRTKVSSGNDPSYALGTDCQCLQDGTSPVQSTSSSSEWPAEALLMCEPKKGNEELHGVCGTSDSPAQDWWLYTRSSQVHLLSSESKDGEVVHSSPRLVLNMAHISKLIHWEGVAEGIEAAGLVNRPISRN